MIYDAKYVQLQKINNKNMNKKTHNLDLSMEVSIVLHPVIQKWGHRCFEFSKEKK